MTMEEIRGRTTNLETRALAFIIAIAGALAYLWLQNTWGEIARLRDEIITLRDTAAQVYVTQATSRSVEDRLDRLEAKLEKLADDHMKIMERKRGDLLP